MDEVREDGRTPWATEERPSLSPVDADRVSHGAVDPLAGLVSARVEIGSMTGGAVTGAVVHHQSVLPLDQEAVPENYLRRVAECYARPTGFQELLAARQSIVVFDIAEGGGRSTHAEALAAALLGLLPVAGAPAPAAGVHTEHSGQSRPGESVRAARLSFGGSPHFPLERLPLQQHRVWFLEIPADEDDFAVADSFGYLLADLNARLRAQRCRLLVLTRPEQWRRIAVIGHELCISARTALAPVPAAQVAHARLLGRKPGIDADAWLRHPEIAELLSPASLRAAVEIAETIIDAERTPPHLLPTDHPAPLPRQAASGGAGMLDEQRVWSLRVAMVLNARAHWRPQLLAWHRAAQRTAFERDFQLAAAVLTDVPLAFVYLGAITLHRELLERSSPAQHPHTMPGVIAMLDAIGADTGEEERVRFSWPGWADAILEYFWVDRPLSRTAFIQWLAAAPQAKAEDTLQAISAEHKRALARRIVRFALRWAARHERDKPLEALALAWRESAPQLFDELVAMISTVAAAHGNDPEIGGREEIAALLVHQGYVHRLLLKWAKAANVGLAHVALAVCDGAFAAHHTSKALVRLKHAGRILDDRTRPLLGAAIARLWRESSTRSTLITEIAAWSDNPAHQSAGRVAFAQLAALTVPTDTATMTDGPAEKAGLALLDTAPDYTPDPAALARCWRAFLAHHSGTDRSSEDTGKTDQDTEIGRLVLSWLNTAAHCPVQRGTVLDVLRSAVCGATGTDRESRDAVRGIANRWAASHPAYSTLYHELTEGFDADLRTPRPPTPAAGPTNTPNPTVVAP